MCRKMRADVGGLTSILRVELRQGGGLGKKTHQYEFFVGRFKGLRKGAAEPRALLCCLGKNRD